MNGELQWHPISYDSGPETNVLSDVPSTEISAADFPAPHDHSGRPGRVDSPSFANYLLELLHRSGRAPESVVWAVNHVQGTRGLTHCLAFEQRQIYRIIVVSDEYEAWLDRFDAETAELFAPTEHPVPEFWFMEASFDNQRVTHIGGFPFESARNGERLDQYERADQFRTDLHAWLRAASPAPWHGQDDRPKKDAFLERSGTDAGTHVSIDEEQLAATFRRLLTERGQENREGASDADIASFAEIAGFEMPSELQTVLRIANGCYLGSAYCDFMSAAEITAACKSQNEAFDASTFDMLTRFNRNPDSRTLPIDLTPKWVPITDHRSGSYLGIDLLPGPSGKPGQIIFYDRGESGTGAVVLVENLLDFFEHELAGQIVNIDDPIPIIIDAEDEFANEEDDDEFEIVEEPWIWIKLHEVQMRASQES